ncbi:HPr family phosphocarrier protein [Candidatus Poribacteria bacterium]|jgi:phosphotransferase system HPr (HPr) family protein|nr:HPr family phosphocarrier protein [Candidatus Poribacteria bacterium]MBT5532686.1 HPr family phosphocarrier protein [Candidatus Poribacteria bacterium]MBT5714583.1 HPr family phosphocarrier protein [Candidatus Poribacteria bacterium]MBT7100053.1 HPr family phosphocarrier protein [Candidatus Poribacteria bacterium]MBT7808294.1 HPr family phosphocarrier protein [Candidatus Poribacteria bacterium]
MAADHATQVVVLNERGLHLHVASLLAREASAFTADVFLRRGKVAANAKSVMSLALLAAPCGTELELSANGDDAQAAVACLARRFGEKFDAP